MLPYISRIRPALYNQHLSITDIISWSLRCLLSKGSSLKILAISNKVDPITSIHLGKRGWKYGAGAGVLKRIFFVREVVLADTFRG